MNYATYCEPIAVRDDSESVPDFKSRARAILAERGGGCIVWGAPEEVEWVDAEPEIVEIAGASAGVEVGFGGLPKMNVNDDPSGSSKGE